MTRGITLLFTGLLFAIPSFGQSAVDDVFESIRAYAGTLGTHSFPKENEVFHFSYRTTYGLWDTIAGSDYVQEVEMTIAPKAYHYKSSEMDLFQDEEQAIVVSHLNKMIFFQNSIQKEMAGRDHASKNAMRDSLFELVTQKVLHEYTNQKGEKVMQLTMLLNDEAKRIFNAEKMVYHWHPEKQKLLRSEMYFRPNYKLRYQIVDFREEDFEAKKRIRKKAIRQVMDSKGRLLEAYKDYQIIDNKRSLNQMKSISNSIFWLFSILAVLAANTAFGQLSQPHSVYRYSDVVATCPNCTLSFTGMTTLLENRLNTAEIQVTADLYEANSIYNLGHDEALDVQVPITINLNQGTTTVLSESYTLTLSDDKPEQLWLIDVTEFVADASTGNPYDIEVVFDAGHVFNGGAIQAALETAFNVTVDLVADYGIDVRQTGSAEFAPGFSIQNPVTDASGRFIRLGWNDYSGLYHFPSFEIQILRLYNSDEYNANIQGPEVVETTIDWSSAISIYCESPALFKQLTVPGGSGYYVWRVRPIGNYFEGGIANAQNWGGWSTHPADGSIVSVGMSNLNSPNYFRIDDPDDDKNWIYNRTFTEEDKTQEQIVYGDGLQNPRQTQVYLSTPIEGANAGNRMASQNILDYSGRPALVTLPVPVDGRLNNYIPNLVQNANGDPYTAIDFDLNNSTPAKIKDDAGTHYSYYSNNNDDLSIPDAEGYPMTRTTYKRDGTNRVSEQSSPGENTYAW